MSTQKISEIMVELYPGFGDGYGIVRVDDSGKPAVNPARAVTHWKDEDGTRTKMPKATAEFLSRSSITLVDGGVRIEAGAIKRIIGSLDCPEAIRIRAGRFVKNWLDAGFVDRVSDEQLAAAMALPTYMEIAEALQALRG